MAPYVLGYVLTDGLRQTLSVFHGGDEPRYHLPMIRRFLEDWPALDFRHYESATTPLFHLSVAVWGLAFGDALHVLRTLNWLYAMLGALAVFLFLRAKRTDLIEAMGLALAFGLSPYVFGSGFVLLTYPLAFLLWFGSVWFWTTGRPAGRLLGAGLLTLAALTRQSVLWSILPLAADATERSPRRQLNFGTVALLVLPVVSVAPFFLLWGDFVPPSSSVHSAGNLRPETPFIGAAVLGAYGLFLRGTGLYRLLSKRLLFSAGLILPTAALALLVGLRPGPGDDGLVWRVAGMLPEWRLGEAAVAVAAGIGAMFIVEAIMRGRRVLWIFAVSILLFSCTNAKVFQVYFDPYLIVWHLLAVVAYGESRGKAERVGLAVLVLGELMYLLFRS